MHEEGDRRMECLSDKAGGVNNHGTGCFPARRDPFLITASSWGEEVQSAQTARLL